MKELCATLEFKEKQLFNIALEGWVRRARLEVNGTIFTKAGLYCTGEASSKILTKPSTASRSFHGLRKHLKNRLLLKAKTLIYKTLERRILRNIFGYFFKYNSFSIL